MRTRLQLRDVTKPVTFDVTYGGTVDTGNGVKAGFKLNGKINRLEYGLKWSNKRSPSSPSARALRSGNLSQGRPS